MTTLEKIEKIRAEIQKVLDKERDFTSESAKAQALALMWVLELFDKYAYQKTDINYIGEFCHKHGLVLMSKEMADKYAEQEPRWIPVSERLPELNKPLLVTAYHRVCYAHMISESGNYGYPVFRLHEIKDSARGWVQETISHEPYSKGRIDAWMYIDIPEPYKVESQESEDRNESDN